MKAAIVVGALALAGTPPLWIAASARAAGGDMIGNPSVGKRPGETHDPTSDRITTEIGPAGPFWIAEDYHQQREEMQGAGPARRRTGHAASREPPRAAATASFR